jgi:hypothetical protein
VRSSKPSDKERKTSRYTGVGGGGGAAGLSFCQVAGDTLRDTVAAVVSNGDAILFGRTSDGGALSVRVLSDGSVDVWYPTDASELQELLDGLRTVAST